MNGPHRLCSHCTCHGWTEQANSTLIWFVLVTFYPPWRSPKFSRGIFLEAFITLWSEYLQNVKRSIRTAVVFYSDYTSYYYFGSIVVGIVRQCKYFGVVPKAWTGRHQGRFGEDCSVQDVPHFVLSLCCVPSKTTFCCNFKFRWEWSLLCLLLPVPIRV